MQRGHRIQANAVRSELTRMLHDLVSMPPPPIEEKKKFPSKALKFLRDNGVTGNIYDMSRLGLDAYQIHLNATEDQFDEECEEEKFLRHQLIEQIRRALRTGEFPPNMHAFMKECVRVRISIQYYAHLLNKIHRVYYKVETLRQQRRKSPPGGDDTNPSLEMPFHPPVVHEIEDDD